jgi:hypothetical protein
MSTTIHSGGLVIKDPNSEEVYVVDWGSEHLATGVEITSSDWFITGRDSALVGDSESVLSGSRRASIRLSDGTLGYRYTVTNRIVTNESPTQTKDASFDVLIEQE